MEALTVADTAFAIAAVRAEEASFPISERLFEDPYARLFVARGAHAADATQRFLDLPLFREGIRLRTRFIDDAVRDALAGGLRQLVVLGAGFDTRGLRMPEVRQSGANVFEIDLPGQLERKRAWLADARVPLSEHLVFVGFDFGGPWEALDAALRAQGFVWAAPTAFVCEGVIGYIDDAAIEETLRFVGRAGGPGSRLVFTAHEDAFAPETAEQRMRRHGFTNCVEVGLDALWSRWLPTEPHPYAHVSRVGVATR